MYYWVTCSTESEYRDKKGEVHSTKGYMTNYKPSVEFSMSGTVIIFREIFNINI
jgi:hypothetical protein